MPGDVGASEDLFGGGIDLVEVLRADEPLNQRYVRTVRFIEGESLREGFEQSGVVGLGVAKHGGVRLEQDVDGRDWVRFFEREYRIPVSFHADDGPALHIRVIQPLIQPPECEVERS